MNQIRARIKELAAPKVPVGDIAEIIAKEFVIPVHTAEKLIILCAFSDALEDFFSATAKE